MNGRLSQHPLAELIREITAAGISGALRLAYEHAKVAIYFEDGKLVFATSNLRAHRLSEILRRSGLTEAQIGKTNEAVTALTKALELNTQRLAKQPTALDLRKSAATDQSLAALRGLREFQQLIGLPLGRAGTESPGN